MENKCEICWRAIQKGVELAKKDGKEFNGKETEGAYAALHRRHLIFLNNLHDDFRLLREAIDRKTTN